MIDLAILRQKIDHFGLGRDLNDRLAGVGAWLGPTADPLRGSAGPYEKALKRFF